eukprot:13437748-Alexandrium_andersonii.AAC.1
MAATCSLFPCSCLHVPVPPSTLRRLVLLLAPERRACAHSWHCGRLSTLQEESQWPGGRCGEWVDDVRAVGGAP